jgi:hypothetical protein
MTERRRNHGLGCDLVRKGRLAAAAALLCALLAACGGDDDSSTPAAEAAAPPASAVPPVSAAPPARAEPPAAPPADPGESGGLVAVASAKGSTTLSWTPPTTNDDDTPVALTGYRIYWGVSEGYYPHSVTLDNPGLTRHVVDQLPPATYYFVATALSVDGESEPSNVVTMKVL